MITYNTRKVKADKEFNSLEELNSFVSNYGTKKLDGTDIYFQVIEKDIEKVRAFEHSDLNVNIVLTENNLKLLSIVVDNKTINTSKLDLIKDYCQRNDIRVESKAYRLLLKTLNDKSLEEDLQELADKCNSFITVDYLESNYIIDSTVHPVNVLKAIILNKGSQSILRQCRRVYNDKGIMSGIKNHLEKIIKIRYANLYNQSTRAWYDIIPVKRLLTLYYCLCKTNNIDLALLEYNSIVYGGSYGKKNRYSRKTHS